MKITKLHRQAIHLMILGPKGMNQLRVIAEKCGVTRSTIQVWKRDPDFQREYLHQLDQYRNNFEEVALSERKARVTLLNELCEQTEAQDERSVRLKMALLEQIRIEMGEGTPAQINHLHRMVGVNLPPRASSYEEWMKQNRRMEDRPEPVPANGHGSPN